MNGFSVLGRRFVASIAVGVAGLLLATGPAAGQQCYPLGTPGCSTTTTTDPGAVLGGGSVLDGQGPATTPVPTTAPSGLDETRVLGVSLERGASGTSAGAAGRGGLASTGLSAGWTVAAGLVLVTMGVGLWRAGRKRLGST